MNGSKLADGAAAGTPLQASPTSDREIRAYVLDHIPDNGITLAELSDTLPQHRERVVQAVARLNELGLIETDGNVVRTTAFMQKAKRIFHIR